MPTLESAGQRRDTLVRGAEENHAMGGRSSCRPRVATLYPLLSPQMSYFFFFKFLLFYYLKTVVFIMILLMAMRILLKGSRRQKEICTPFCQSFIFFDLSFLSCCGHKYFTKTSTIRATWSRSLYDLLSGRDPTPVSLLEGVPGRFSFTLKSLLT